VARPKGTEIKLSPEEIEKLAQIGATQAEIAHFLGIATSTLEERLARPKFRAAYDRGMANLKLSLRRKQVLLADGGNVGMLIWLGKQLLGQRNNIDMHHGGPDGKPLLDIAAVRALLQADDAN
jgi:hypothetical protein